MTLRDMSIRKNSDGMRNYKSKHSTENATPAKSFPGLVTSQGAGNSQIKVLETDNALS